PAADGPPQDHRAVRARHRPGCGPVPRQLLLPGQTDAPGRGSRRQSRAGRSVKARTQPYEIDVDVAGHHGPAHQTPASHDVELEPHRSVGFRTIDTELVQVDGAAFVDIAVDEDVTDGRVVGTHVAAADVAVETAGQPGADAGFQRIALGFDLAGQRARGRVAELVEVVHAAA